MIPKCNYSKKELNLILSCVKHCQEFLKDVAAKKITDERLSAINTLEQLDEVRKLITKTKQLIKEAKYHSPALEMNRKLMVKSFRSCSLWQHRLGK